MYELKSDISQYLSSFHPWHVSLTLAFSKIKGAVSRNSAKLGNKKMPVKSRET